MTVEGLRILVFKDVLQGRERREVPLAAEDDRGESRDLKTLTVLLAEVMSEAQWVPWATFPFHLLES